MRIVLTEEDSKRARRLKALGLVAAKDLQNIPDPNKSTTRKGSLTSPEVRHGTANSKESPKTTWFVLVSSCVAISDDQQVSRLASSAVRSAVNSW